MAFPCFFFFFYKSFSLSSVVTIELSLQFVIIFCCNSDLQYFKKLLLSYFMQYNQLAILQWNSRGRFITGKAQVDIGRYIKISNTWSLSLNQGSYS